MIHLNLIVTDKREKRRGSEREGERGREREREGERRREKERK